MYRTNIRFFFKPVPAPQAVSPTERTSPLGLLAVYFFPDIFRLLFIDMMNPIIDFIHFFCIRHNVINIYPFSKFRYICGFRRLMHKYHLICPYRGPNPYKQMARALKTSNVAENLLQRDFECYGPRMVLLTDITYLPFNGTFAYLSIILDAYTKQYMISDSLTVDFVLETVNKLIDNRGFRFMQRP